MQGLHLDHLHPLEVVFLLRKFGTELVVVRRILFVPLISKDVRCVLVEDILERVDART